MGRPSTYTEQVAEAICNRLSEGEPLREICRDEGMPAWRTVYGWVQAHPEFNARIARARELGFDAIAEDALAIADDGRNDWMEKYDKEGRSVGYELNGEHVQRSKLRIESRLKLLAKWCPKKYGERSAMELTGANGGPVQVSDTERAAKVAALMAAAQARKDDADSLV